jgi:hypothetical protein
MSLPWCPREQSSRQEGSDAARRRWLRWSARSVPLAALIFSGCGGSAPAHKLLTPYPGGPAPRGLVSPNNVFDGVRSTPRAAVMLVHGGSFLFVGKKTLLTNQSDWWHARGYATYDVDYRPGLPSLSDVLAAYDWLQARVGSKTPVCVVGDSVGGTLALLSAFERPAIACVITEGAIANAQTMPASFRRMILARFIPGHLAAWSPVNYGRRIRSPMLMAGSTSDTTVPERQQLTEMKAARPQTHTMLLSGAPAANSWKLNFTHANVTARALSRFQAAELRLVPHSSQAR